MSSRQFDGRQERIEIVAVPDTWSENACGGSAADLDRIARFVHEHASSLIVPLLVLPTLARELLDEIGPVAGVNSAVQVLRSLGGRIGTCVFDLQLVLVDGIDSPEAQAAAASDIVTVRDRVRQGGVQVGSADTVLLDVGHPARWRVSLNRLSAMGDDRFDCARRLLSTISPTQLESAWSDPDARRVFELAPADVPARPRDAVASVSISTDEAESVRSEVAARLDRNFARGVQRIPGTPRRQTGLKDKRIAFVCEKMADRSGGAERVLSELANELCARGYQVDILSHESRDQPPFYPLQLGVVHTNLSSQRGAVSMQERVARKGKTALQAGALPFPADRLAFKVRYRSFAKSLATYIDAVRPDVVVPFMPPAIVATALASTSHRPRLVASTHNAPEQDFTNPDRWDPGTYARRRRLELMDRMDAITVLLPQYVEWYDSSIRQRLTVIPNVVEPIPPEVLERSCRRPTILAVGRIADTKRHDLSLRAFARLAEEFPEWQMKILGVGPMLAEVTKLRDELGLQGRADLPGHTSEIGEEYLSSSILCHPARFEGFPLAVTEALASALPVVGFTDCSGVNSLAVDGDNGLLVDPGDGSDDARLAGLADALRRLMKDEPLRTGLGERGPVSMAPYAPELVVDLWESALFPEG